MYFYRLISGLVPQSIKNQYHLAQAAVASMFFGFPARQLQVIGVTGTNGKTTTTQFIARILERAGYKAAVASTINFQIGEKQWVNASKFTTLSPWKLQKFLHEAVQAGCDYVVLETSSHALDQNRVWGVPYAIAVITNVTREHLDYHKTMTEYRSAKRKLFLSAKQAVINLDMENPEYFNINTKPSALFYSVTNSRADLLAEQIKLNREGVEFMVNGVSFHLNVPGLFNVENALAALGVARLLGIDFAIAQAALASIDNVPGRMERVSDARGREIFIDYAVTPDAFEKLYATILPFRLPNTQIIHIFGACGERDRGKRPMMGAIASHYADIIILTNEDPYDEDPEQIIDDIEKGVAQKTDKKYFRISDRREAIHKGLQLARRGDIVLITGKGAEVTLAVRGERLPWDEKQIIEEELAKVSA
jgi:UDP-N-acetylmuramoyl-L-alanyl-D-glutamate--2,6-diaminopimelate ligase